MGRELDNIDLSVSQRKEITALLKRYLPDTEVWAYGSRVKFTAKPSSDLDLVAFTSKDQNAAIAKLQEAFEESSLPFRVDLFIWDKLPKQFHKNIEAERVVLQKKAEKKVLPEGWEETTFIHAVTVNPTVKLTKGKEYPFVDMKSVDPSWREATFSELRIFKGGGTKFIPNDTLMARITPCLENGKIARYMPKGENDKAFGSTEFIVIRGKTGITDNDFAYYLTTWPGFREFAVSQMTGSLGRQRVPTISLAGFTFNLPPLPEQKAIAHILGSLDDKIELNRRMNETLEAMVQALFTSWFVDFNPVIDNALAAGNEIPEELKEKAEIRKALGNTRKPLPEEIRTLFPSEFEYTEEMGWIPKGWSVGAFGSIAIQKRLPAHPSSISTNTPYIGLEHMPMCSISLGNWGLAEDIRSGKSWFATKDILFGKLRPYFHKVGVAPVNGVCSTDIVVITPKTEEWFSTALCIASSKAFIEYTTACSTGTKMPRTNWKDMAGYKVCLPTKSVERIFDNSLKSSVMKILAIIHANRELSRTRDTLLPKLLSGEIRIPEAEKLVGDLEKTREKQRRQWQELIY